MTKVLHVFARMDRGGAEMRTMDMMWSLVQDREIDFEFVALSGKSGALDETIRKLGGLVHYCQIDARFPVRFFKLLRLRQPDVVHSHVYLTSGLVLAIARAARVPKRIAHFRTTGTDHTRSRRQRIMDRFSRFLISRFATDIVGVSEGAIELGWSSRWRDDQRCRVIYPGVDGNPVSPGRREEIRRSLGYSESDLVVAHVGRMVLAKNHRRLATIFSRLVEREPRAKLMMIGRESTDIASDVRQILKNHGSLASARFLGERNDVPDLLAAADVLLFPSTREGLPGVVLEALATGLPVVASSLPGVQEIKKQVPSLVTLDLRESDHEWAKACQHEMVSKSSLPKSRIAGSEFDLQASLANHVALWKS